ncbi:50S ribosomal protein L14 [Grifola frondosa]|uniref:50S ribosomal protein L14 n=1 Tax=Grifola frondosa TaxID=5627 RepID=A0A1C7MJ02_GRIFR|nr:50S ribosomal protein L14 [Grifola frondosa]
MDGAASAMRSSAWLRRPGPLRHPRAVPQSRSGKETFDDNAAVLLNNKREMLGTRIGGIVSADLRMKGWGKIVSLAPKAI